MRLHMQFNIISLASMFPLHMMIDVNDYPNPCMLIFTVSLLYHDGPHSVFSISQEDQATISQCLGYVIKRNICSYIGK